MRFPWDFDCCVGTRRAGAGGRTASASAPEELAALTRAAGVMADRLARYGRGPDRFGLIHADIRLANLLVNGPDIQVIDFDDCGFGWFMFDLATAVSFMEHDPRVPELCDAWVRGYSQGPAARRRGRGRDRNLRPAAPAAARRLGRLAPVRRRGAGTRR